VRPGPDQPLLYWLAGWVETWTAAGFQETSRRRLHRMLPAEARAIIGPAKAWELLGQLAVLGAVELSRPAGGRRGTQVRWSESAYPVDGTRDGSEQKPQDEQAETTNKPHNDIENKDLAVKRNHKETTKPATAEDAPAPAIAQPSGEETAYPVDGTRDGSEQKPQDEQAETTNKTTYPVDNDKDSSEQKPQVKPQSTEGPPVAVPATAKVNKTQRVMRSQKPQNENKKAPPRTPPEKGLLGNIYIYPGGGVGGGEKPAAEKSAVDAAWKVYLAARENAGISRGREPVLNSSRRRLISRALKDHGAADVHLAIRLLLAPHSWWLENGYTTIQHALRISSRSGDQVEKILARAGAERASPETGWPQRGRNGARTGRLPPRPQKKRKTVTVDDFDPEVNGGKKA